LPVVDPQGFPVLAALVRRSLEEARRLDPMRRAAPQERSKDRPCAAVSRSASRTQTIQAACRILIPRDKPLANAVRVPVQARWRSKDSGGVLNRSRPGVIAHTQCRTKLDSEAAHGIATMHHARTCVDARLHNARTNAARIKIGSLFA
jgi:hypothetical protein